MYFRTLYFGETYNGLIYLRRYLNEILKINPPLSEINKFDNDLSKAISQFLVRYNALYPEKKLPFVIGVTNELWAAVGVMLGEQRLRQEVEKLKTSEPIIVKQLQGQPLVVIPPYTAEMQACDKKLAEIFGGAGAVAAGTGFEPKGGKVPAYDGKFRGKGFGDEHLYSRMHLYGSNDKTKVTDIYIPCGAEYMGKNPYSDEDSFMFYYKELYKVKNVTLFTSHVANFINPKIGTKFVSRTKIGQIGGKGGDGQDYIHSHLAIHKGRGYNEQNRISFSEVFC